MEIGAMYPQGEIGNDPAAMREYAERVEAAGYDHLLGYDHVVGAAPGREYPYDVEDPFHEPLTTFAHLAAVTDELSFVTGILILPQRQTALVAKQAAMVDLFADGGFRLGVGVGWNPLEYVALGEAFSERGRRIEEQVRVLRALWTDELVEVDGEFHELPNVGINPRPVQRPIPIWMGGSAEVVKRRIARMADGWIPQFRPGEEAEDELADLYEYADREGRDPDEIGIHGRTALREDPDGWVERVGAWRDLGADYLSVGTDADGLSAYVERLEAAADALAAVGLL